MSQHSLPVRVCEGPREGKSEGGEMEKKGSREEEERESE